MDMLLFLQDAAAGAAQAPGQQPSASEGLLRMLPMFAMIFVVMYFLMIRPQNKQRKERDAMMAGLKKNDHVLTSAGFYGIVKQIKPEDPDLTLCIDERKDVCIRVSKSSIAGLVKASGTPEGEPKSETQEKKG
ncbi:MAG: preprotein translocase subunit YajC [Planctomycetaceae bacterium]|nr:preprotein translocase subunit YajC [Planctomycetaceae bacterium]